MSAICCYPRRRNLCSIFTVAGYVELTLLPITCSTTPTIQALWKPVVITHWPSHWVLATGPWLPAPGYRPTATGQRPPATGQRPTANGQRPTANGQRPTATGQRPPATGQRPPANGHRPTANGHRPTANGHRPTATGQRPPANGHRPTATGQRPPANGHWPTANGQRPPANGHRPTATGQRPLFIYFFSFFFLMGFSSAVFVRLLSSIKEVDTLGGSFSACELGIKVPTPRVLKQLLNRRNLQQFHIVEFRSCFAPVCMAWLSQQWRSNGSNKKQGASLGLSGTATRTTTS
jgi:hypothetical protein